MSQIPREFDDFQPRHYDPQFTADISMQMNIPDRIEVAGNTVADYMRMRPVAMSFVDEQDLTEMRVPDKIVVLGHDRSVGAHHQPDLHLDLVPLPNEHMFVNLQTPPRVITLDEQSFPTLENTGPTEYSLNGRVRGQRFSRDENQYDRSVGPSEVAVIQQQLTTLSAHVKRLELENNRRWRRELVLYPAFLGYIFIKLARWLVATR